jgi:hypothetical protein
VLMPGDRGTGWAWEHVVGLANATGKDLWINIPHLTVESQDDYLGKLSRLIAYGSDGVEPYAGPVANPVYPPLRSDLKVYVEYSNEIWAGNFAFAQGVWSQRRAEALGISPARFNARMASQAWGAMESQLGVDRVIRVAAAFTALEWYTRAHVDEFYDNAALLRPEVLAITTYFGNNIQYWAYDNISGVRTRPYTDGYWNGSAALEADLNRTFDQWRRYQLSETAYDQGGGRDQTDVSGGFSPYIREISTQRGLPIIAYEGGPSIYTDDQRLDGTGNSEDDGVTIFMEALNRHPRFEESYRIHLEFAKWRGLWSHSAFVDSSAWGRYGQWGHREYVDQPLSQAVKARFLIDWAAEHAGIRHPDEPRGAVPVFTTGAALPAAISGLPYSVGMGRHRSGSSRRCCLRG